MAGEDEDEAPIAKGQPLARTEAELDAAASIDESDIESGIDFWHQHAPVDKRNLIDATEETGE